MLCQNEINFDNETMVYIFAFLLKKENFPKALNNKAKQL
jgi:hypothetical protein